MWHRLEVGFDITILGSKQILKNPLLCKNLIVAGFGECWILAPWILLHYFADILAPTVPVSCCQLTRALNGGALLSKSTLVRSKLKKYMNLEFSYHYHNCQVWIKI